MNTALILFGIQSIIRIGRIGKDALEQYARDDAAIFPDLLEPEFDSEVFVYGFFKDADYQSYVKGGDAPYAEYWNNIKTDPHAIDALFTAAVKIKAEEGVNLRRHRRGGDVMNVMHAQGVLRRHRRDRGHAVAAECREGFQVRFDARAAAGVAAGDGEYAWKGSGHRLFFFRVKSFPGGTVKLV